MYVKEHILGNNSNENGCYRVSLQLFDKIDFEILDGFIYPYVSNKEEKYM